VHGAGKLRWSSVSSVLSFRGYPASMTLHAPQNEQRRASRFACDLVASVRDRGRARSPARLIDISTHGCRIETMSGPHAGDWIWLSLPGLEAQYVRVVWSAAGFAGLEFAAPLTPAVLHNLVSPRPPSERRLTQLQELSRRCLQLSERLSGYGDATCLLTLSQDCKTSAVVEELRARFS
jgi:hypothetical protein